MWMICVTTSYIAFAQNWVLHLQRNIPHVRYTIFALDARTYDQLHAGGYVVERVPDSTIGGGPCRFCMVKFRIALDLVLRGEHAVIGDSDLFFLKDPTPLLPWTEDITTQCDCRTQGSLYRDDTYTAVLNIGFVAMRPTMLVVMFLVNLLDLAERFPHVWDQQLATDLLMGDSLEYGNATMKLPAKASVYRAFQRHPLPSLRVLRIEDVPNSRVALGADESTFATFYAAHTNGLQHVGCKLAVWREWGGFHDLDSFGRPLRFASPRYNVTIVTLPDLHAPPLDELARSIVYGTLIANATKRVLVLPNVTCDGQPRPLRTYELLSFYGLKRGPFTLLHGRVYEPGFMSDSSTVQALASRRTVRHVFEIAEPKGVLGPELATMHESAFALALARVPKEVETHPLFVEARSNWFHPTVCH